MNNLQFSAEVENAFKVGKPVVALESTIISHGMPFPQNLQCAREVEDIIRANGAIPATIGILSGEIFVGMSSAQLETFAQTPCVKVSRRDLSTVIGTKGNGATTVATTMLIAHMAGIPIFVTGGIGGVHRGAEATWDVSADLTELGRTPVAVVCAGAKSILDLPKTLEYLETQGVSVIGLRTRTFPAFFTPSSGLPVPTVCETESEVAAIINSHNDLALKSGMVIGNPIPAELQQRLLQ
jgi:pseudouridine-5'-phosphate glycosidase